jgi:integrase
LLLFSHNHRNTNPNPSTPFPASVPSLISFITSLHAKNYAPATITTFISALSFINKLYHAHDPQQHFLIAKMLEGTRKLGQVVDTRQPITLAILHKLTACLSIIHHDPFSIALLKAMFLLAFHTFLRVGEFTVRSQQAHNPNTLLAADCTVNFKGLQVSSVSLTLRNSKHNHARPFHISVPANQSHNCPASALHDYLKLARPKSGPLFQSQTGAYVTRHYFQNQLQRCLRAAKIDTKHYKTHSF